MQESARAALSWVRSNASKLGLAEDFLKGPGRASPRPGGRYAQGRPFRRRRHGHRPHQPVHRPHLPQRRGHDRRDHPAGQGSCAIGGVKEKVLAAKRAGLKTVILPAGNEPDVLEMDAPLREGMTFVYANSVDDVLAHALKPARK